MSNSASSSSVSPSAMARWSSSLSARAKVFSASKNASMFWLPAL
jgi:hypothetical protein